MGLSSSQARLLNLTGRMHQIEYKAAKFEAEKLQMANESRQVYLEYQNALEKTKIQIKTLNSDGSVDFIDATYNILVDRGYQLKLEGEDKEIVSESTARNYELANGNKEYFAALETGRVTEDDQIVNGAQEIYTADQLVAALSSGASTDIRLMTDINMSGVNYNSANLNNKIFDGNGHSITGLNKALFSSVFGSNAKITNLSISGNTSDQAILANNMYNGEISNVKVSGSINSSQNKVGAFVGCMSGGIINNCSSSANVNSSGEIVGGLIGECSNITIENCSTEGNVTGAKYVGGLIGNCCSTNITNCTANTNTTGTKIEEGQWGQDNFVGGFAGRTYNSTLEYCSSSGTVNAYGTSLVGGFIGYSDNHSTIKNSNSYSNVNANIASQYSGSTPLLASFIGGLDDTIITNSNSYGDVNCNGGYDCGGFAGGYANINHPSSIDGCYTNSTANFLSTGDTFVTVTNQQTSPVNNTITVTPPTIQTTTVVDNPGADNARNLFDRMRQNGYATMEEDDPRLQYGDDNTWLTNMVNEGKLFIFKPMQNSEDLYEVSVSTDTNLQEVEDPSLLRKAEAKYEADMRRIDMKDRKYDYDLAALDNERNAMKNEMETLKTVAKDNVERTFKLFG